MGSAEPLLQVLLLSRLLSVFSSHHYSAHPARVCARVYTRTPTKWQALSDSQDLDSRVMYMRGRGISKDQIIAPRPSEDGTRTRRDREYTSRVNPDPAFPYPILPLFTLIYALYLFLSPTLCLTSSSHSLSRLPLFARWQVNSFSERIVNKHSSFILVCDFTSKLLAHKKNFDEKKILFFVIIHNDWSEFEVIDTFG